MQMPSLALTTPYHNLIQRNTNLLMRFWTSPEVLNESRAAIDALMRQTQASTFNLFQSTAFSDLARELFASYSQFLAEAMKAQIDTTIQAQHYTLDEAKRAPGAAAAAFRRAA